MDLKTLILTDLREEEPRIPFVMQPDYVYDDTPLLKLHSLELQMRRAKKLKDRIGMLLVAYYMGQVLASMNETSTERSRCSNYLSEYFRNAATRTYYLFEILGPEQIVRTKRLRLPMITKVKDAVYLEVINEMIVIAGARSLGGEVVSQ